jgi:hypothetical protein
VGEADPAKTIDTSKSLDPEAERIRAVFHHWDEMIGAGVRITVKDAVAGAMSSRRQTARTCTGLCARAMIWRDAFAWKE